VAVKKACVETPRRGRERLPPRAGYRGQRSEIMADTLPLQRRNCPPSGRNIVRYAIGTVSAIAPESCPSWAGTRNNFNVSFQEALDDALVSRHEKHGDFINKVFKDEALGAFFRAWMLDQVYGRLAGRAE